MSETRIFPYPIDVPEGLTVRGASLLPSLLSAAGKVFYVDPANGSDSNSGRSARSAFATLYKAHSAMTAGKNDTCILIGDGGTTGTARLSAALAASVDSSATTGLLTWSKNACHLVGVTAPTYFSSRARIAPPSGTYTVTTFGSAGFLKVTASGCVFSNFSMFHGFSTGGAAQLTVEISSANRNYFHKVHIGGMGDQASADDTGSACVRLTASAENTFDQCVIGLDTVTRGAANGSILASGQSSRNVFQDCIFPIHADATSPLIFLTSGSSPLDRETYFIRCIFSNAVGSATSTLAAAATLPASTGGALVFKDCMRLGITDWGTDANSLAQCYVGGFAGGSTNHAGDDIGRGIVSVAS